jgi:hypothetical protein
MHNQAGVDLYLRTIEKVKEAGGTIECGGKVRLYWLIVVEN